MQIALGPTSLFRLPPELRLMIWKLLLPGRRVFKARSSGSNLDPRRGDDRRFVFGFDSKASQPILSQICAESRQCLLDHGNGQYIFGLKGEAGLWWGPEDVLLFDREWWLRWATPSLEGLKGLDCVKNIALDADQARYIYYEYALVEDDNTNQDDSDDGDHEDDEDETTDSHAQPTTTEPEAPQPQSITLGCLSCLDNPHFLEYFPALNKLMIVFENTIQSVCGCVCSCSAAVAYSCPISQFLENDRAYSYVTFRRDNTSMDDAVREVTKFRWLWMQSKDMKHDDWAHCYYDNKFIDSHRLYDFCVDESRTGHAYEPTRVTFVDMMDNEEWAL